MPPNPGPSPALLRSLSKAPPGAPVPACRGSPLIPPHGPSQKAPLLEHGSRTPAHPHGTMKEMDVRRLWWLVALGFLAIPWALAEDWRLTRSQTLSQAGAREWRYTLSPAGKEAQELWRRLSEQYRDHLRAGYRVELGAWRVYFLGGRLRVEPHCQAVNPACFTFGALPVVKERQDRFLLELSHLLHQALTQAQGTGGVVLLSRLFRLEVVRGAHPPYFASPSSWRP